MPEVLVIDDNPTQLCVREAVLRGSGLSVQTASSAEQALDILRDQESAGDLRIIVTDHVLPGASGAVFVQELRRFRPAVPVVVITGMDEAESEYAGLGVIFLHKPCPPEEMIARVRRAIGSSNS
jgi:CheY-like chemotaxis protein